jgi:LemA protein
MSTAVVVLIVAAVVVVLVLLWGVSTYNRLVRQRQQVQSAGAQIDVQLKRRHDLIPNLVETVKGYAAHERGTLEAVVQARQQAVDASGKSLPERAESENMLTQALGKMFALSEAYPDLKASQNFLELQGELSQTEEKIAYSRQFYNSSVQTMNTSVQSFPSSMIAGMTGFHLAEFFQASGDDRAGVSVQF